VPIYPPFKIFSLAKNFNKADKLAPTLDPAEADRRMSFFKNF
jgi:hypothetical protein